MRNNQKGFGFVEIIIIAVVLLGIGFVIWRVMSANGSNSASDASKSDVFVMKSIGFNLDYYNESTNHAGEMMFTKLPLQFDQIWGDFGQQDPRTPNDPTKRNPQPTYILPLGTTVQSLVDGTVSKVEELYSGDFTIWVTPNGNDQLNFETEHVSDPSVKLGDKVTSGQVIAEVSPHDSDHHPGFGVLEIGVLGRSGDRPSHTCPYQYLDASVKDDIYKKITALHAAWEKYLGKDVYGDTFALPGCVSLEPFVE
jgi:biotin carboxyl carrier protein